MRRVKLKILEPYYGGRHKHGVCGTTEMSFQALKEYVRLGTTHFCFALFHRESITYQQLAEHRTIFVTASSIRTRMARLCTLPSVPQPRDSTSFRVRQSFTEAFHQETFARQGVYRRVPSKVNRVATTPPFRAQLIPPLGNLGMEQDYWGFPGRYAVPVT
ncbi:hypothetical protein GGTG_11807 [Gaeumannomyces tritici R3-111a-1]|uniref:Uncharacterized protein n=1 Tax=Gaeumannomyces tritici (strain R3-111a-1) TaxID=644352 RepID=J3PE84_GAET3|nr:hypothetical protein GGTG_11807 [Gaeumannomyces tritici R3-111a-1]EJT70784.1 hypothetical protein GGTG_11807 [Gaeumannomyces tritici R3-111a-1]